MNFRLKKTISLIVGFVFIFSWSVVSFAEAKTADLSLIRGNDAYKITIDTDVNVAVVEASTTAAECSFNHKYESDYTYSYTDFDILIKEYFDDPTPLFRLWMIYTADDFNYFNSVVFNVNGEDFSFGGISSKNQLITQEHDVKEQLLILFSEDNVDFLNALLQYGITLLNDDSTNADEVIVPMTLQGLDTVTVDLKANFMVNYLTVIHALGKTNCAAYLGDEFASEVSAFVSDYSLDAILALDSGSDTPLFEETQLTDVSTNEEYAHIIDLLSKSGPWFYNGGSNDMLKCITFSNTQATITSVSFNFGSNLYAPKSSENYPFDIDDSLIRVQLGNGFSLEIPYFENGGIIRLGNGEYFTTQEVDNGLQGYWHLKDTSMGLKHEYNAYINNGQITTEKANEGYNLPSGHYYFISYTGEYTLDYGHIKSSESGIWQWYFNIIDGKPVLMYFDKILFPSDEGLPGKNGYSF